MQRLFYAICSGLLLVSHYCTAVAPVWDPIPIHEAFVSKFTDVTPSIVSPSQPPSPIAEKIPPKPYPDAIWIRGYWAWITEKNDFVWICGVWRRPPPDHVWISGEWINHSGTWKWLRGFWSQAPLNHLSYIQKTPPNAIDDKVPPSPGSNYFWIPGYWEYSPASQQYIWLSGKWELFNQDWVIAPATYMWRPEGYVFVPLYWDWPIDARGKAYSCLTPETGTFTVIEPEIIIRRLIVYYPDYLSLHWHWWHFHPGWWHDCWCLPPWWHWSNWWTLPWGGHWGLWWWWGHPGFFPPFWITLQLSLQIPPPLDELIAFFKNVPKPFFELKPGEAPLLPGGQPNGAAPPKPNIPNDITPGGQVSPPSLPPATMPPGREVMPPPPPPPSSQPQYPAYPEQPAYPPSYPIYPEPPQYVPPPTYYPPGYPRPRPPSDRPRPPSDRPRPPSDRPRPPSDRPSPPSDRPRPDRPSPPSKPTPPSTPPSYRPTPPTYPSPSRQIRPQQPSSPQQLLRPTPPQSESPRQSETPRSKYR